MGGLRFGPVSCQATPAITDLVIIVVHRFLIAAYPSLYQLRLLEAFTFTTRCFDDLEYNLRVYCRHC